MMKLSAKMANCQGSILLYVLWILVIISILAFQLSSSTRALTVSRVSETNRIQKELQLYSAVQLAKFKILSNHWKNLKFDLKINNQTINIEIFNEAGFYSLYDSSNESLKKIFNRFNIDFSMFEKINFNKEGFEKFNDFYELKGFEGFDNKAIDALIPYISIYHQEGVNPLLSPAEVLMTINGVDKFRVSKLMESYDETEKVQLRTEIVEILQSQNKEVSDNYSEYYRVHIFLDSTLYRVFLKYNRSKKAFRVVNRMTAWEPQN